MYWKIHFVTVVLSACNTARGRITAEGVVGLARGFLLAGAAATVVSLWSVDDRSTAALMEQMYFHLVDGFTVPQALRLAMLRLARRPALEQTLQSEEPSSADGLRVEWKRPMHWAGFLVMGASTRLPRGDATPRGDSEALGPAAHPQDDISTIEGWLRSIALQDYAAAIKEYGYDSFQALDAASEEQILEMTQDPDVAMKKPHRHLFLVEWKKRVQVAHS